MNGVISGKDVAIRCHRAAFLKLNNEGVVFAGQFICFFLDEKIEQLGSLPTYPVGFKRKGIILLFHFWILANNIHRPL